MLVDSDCGARVVSFLLGASVLVDVVLIGTVLVDSDCGANVVSFSCRVCVDRSVVNFEGVVFGGHV